MAHLIFLKVQTFYGVEYKMKSEESPFSLLIVRITWKEEELQK